MAPYSTLGDSQLLNALLVEHQGYAPFTVEGLHVQAEAARGVNLALAREDKLRGLSLFANHPLAASQIDGLAGIFPLVERVVGKDGVAIQVQFGIHPVGLVLLHPPVLACVIVVVVPHSSCERQSALNGQHGVEPLAAHHLLVVVACPALHHHQHIECLPPFVVVGLEVVLRMGDEALHLRCQQQVAQHVAVVVGVLAAVAVGHGNGEVVGGMHRMACLVDQLVVEGDFLVRGETLPRPLPVEGKTHPRPLPVEGGGNLWGLNESQPVHIVIVHKRHALGQHLAVVGKERHHVDSRLQRLLFDEGHGPLVARQVHGTIVVGMPA